MRLCAAALVLLLSVPALALIEQADVMPFLVDGGDLTHSHGAFNNSGPTIANFSAKFSQGRLSDAGAIFANFSTEHTNGVEGMTAFRGVVYPIILVDVYDSENVTSAWADLKRSNESDWTTMAMQRALSRGSNTFQFTPSLSVSQTVTYFDVRFRANDTTGDVSTSQDFSFMITYSRPDGPVGLDLMGVVTIIVFVLIAAIIPVFLYLLRRERIRLGLQAVQ